MGQATGSEQSSALQPAFFNLPLSQFARTSHDGKDAKSRAREEATYLKLNKLLPWRWVVERTFGWLGRCRIHSKDYEHLTDSSEAQIRVSMIQLMLRRLTGAKYRDRFRYKRPRRRTTA